MANILYKKIFKHLSDKLIALLVLILTMPVFVLIILLLSLNNKGKVFFKQTRVGKNGRTFKLIKFKTMNDRQDINGNLLSDAERLTSLGAFIRKTSLDELPQLINILKGDMSLIGPRPLLLQYLPLYNNEQNRRHEVRPGITGWAQINGRNAIAWHQKFKYDVWYVDNISIWLDIKIVLLTFITVFKATNINASKDVTMEAFNGSN